MGMVKLALPSLLWIGASVLKLTALLAVRFAVLFAPIWIPVAVAYGGWLARVLRMLASAYMWGVAGAVIVALYLMALVQLYVNDDEAVDGSWRLWFMVLLTVVCWMIMRPFKRMSQTIAQNRTSVINRRARSAQKAMRQKLFAGAAATIGGPGTGAAVQAAQKLRKARGRDDENITEPGNAPTRPEGRALGNQRQQALTHARANARKTQSLGRAGRLNQAASATTEHDARIAGIAAAAGRDTAQGKGPVEGQEAEQAIAAGAPAWRRLDKDEAEQQRQERRARKELLTVSVGQRWDGGDRSAIAPMQVYTPQRGMQSSRRAIQPSPTATTTVRPPQIRRPENARVWNASTPGPRIEDRHL